MERIDKPCYTDYVKRALRFYSRYPHKTDFKSDVDRANWNACYAVLRKCTPMERDIITYVYGEFDTVADNVYAMANQHHIHQNIIWDLMKDIERKVAIERGLWV